MDPSVGPRLGWMTELVWAPPPPFPTHAHAQFENERQWWCCGEPDLDAPGCKYDRHRSYDDE